MPFRAVKIPLLFYKLNCLLNGRRTASVTGDSVPLAGSASEHFSFILAFEGEADWSIGGRARIVGLRINWTRGQACLREARAACGQK